MKVFKVLALVVGLAAGHGAVSAQAAPAPGALPDAVDVSRTLVTKAQFARHHYGRRFHGRPVYGRVYYPRPVYRRVYRPYPVFYARPIYRPRVVCHTRVNVVPTRYGWVRRPVRVCTRRW